MSPKILHAVGIFDKEDSLYAYLYGTTSCLENSKKYSSVFFIHDEKEQRKETHKFFKANYFDIQHGQKYLKLIFANAKIQSGNQNQYVIFINTGYEESEVSRILDEVVDDSNDRTANIVVCFLNSDSYFNYYRQRKDDENTTLIGSPALPKNMDNHDEKPF